MIDRVKSVSFTHMGKKIRFVVNPESPITALLVKVGSTSEFLDADEANQLLALLLNHSGAFERMKAGALLRIGHEKQSRLKEKQG